MPGDYPDYTSPTVEGQTVELDPTFGQPYSITDNAVINAGAYHDFSFTIAGSEYIYRFDTVDILCNTVQSHYAIIYVGSIPIGAKTDSKSLHFTLKDNPSLVFIAGDTLTIRVYNINAAAQSFFIYCQGTKFLRAVGYGHPPQANFTALSLTPKVGDLVTFTDASMNTPTSWDYDFGDLSSHSSLQSPTHQYYYVSSFTPVQIATNQYGFDLMRRVSYITISPTEDMSAYTETDPNNHITKAATQVQLALLNMNETAYLYKDMGAGQINAFTIYETLTTYFISYYCDSMFVQIANQASAVNAFTSIAIGFEIYYSGTQYLLNLFTTDNGSLRQFSNIPLPGLGTYYIKIHRAANATTVTLNVYSNASFTDLIGTLIIVDPNLANVTFRYLYVANVWHTADNRWTTATINNFSYLAV